MTKKSLAYQRKWHPPPPPHWSSCDRIGCPSTIRVRHQTTWANTLQYNAIAESLVGGLSNHTWNLEARDSMQSDCWRQVIPVDWTLSTCIPRNNFGFSRSPSWRMNRAAATIPEEAQAEPQLPTNHQLTEQGKWTLTDRLKKKHLSWTDCINQRWVRNLTRTLFQSCPTFRWPYKGIPHLTN